MPPFPATVDDFGLQGCLYLLALLDAQGHRRPLAPSRPMAIEVMDVLDQHGVIAVHWQPVSNPHRPGLHSTPLEHIIWELRWSVYEPDQLANALQEYLADMAAQDDDGTVRARLWQALGLAEAQGFYEQQLQRYRFEPAWAQDMAYAYRQSPHALSIAQWRYCAWAAARRGASLALEQGLRSESTREAMFQELLRRARAVSGAWSACALTPRAAMPDSALARAFLTWLAPLEAHYWSTPPDAAALFAHIRSRPGLATAPTTRTPG